MMGLRETLNGRPGLAITAISFLVAMSAWLGWKALPHRPHNLVGPGKAFFSDDDGRTWFADSASHVPPYASGGKIAYWVVVYRCAHASPFVVHLETFSMNDKAKIDQAFARGDDWNAVAALETHCALLVKKPGGGEWVSNTPPTESKFADIIRPACPDGSAAGLEKVDPND